MFIMAQTVCQRKKGNSMKVLHLTWKATMLPKFYYSFRRNEVRSEGVDQSEEQGGVRDGSLESGFFLREKSFLSQLLLPYLLKIMKKEMLHLAMTFQYRLLEPSLSCLRVMKLRPLHRKVVAPETHAKEEPTGAPMMRHKRVARKQVVSKSKRKNPFTISIYLSPEGSLEEDQSHISSGEAAHTRSSAEASIVLSPDDVPPAAEQGVDEERPEKHPVSTPMPFLVGPTGDF
jgi:hypothetical protein